jgi:hypothetical protein
MKRGEFKSVRAAAIEAGIIKVPTILDLLKRSWTKATERQRQAWAVVALLRHDAGVVERTF